MSRRVPKIAPGLMVSICLFACMNTTVWAQWPGSSSSAQSSKVTLEQIEAVAGTVFFLSLDFVPKKADVSDSKKLRLAKSTNSSKELAVYFLEAGTVQVNIWGPDKKIKRRIEYKIRISNKNDCGDSGSPGEEVRWVEVGTSGIITLVFVPSQADVGDTNIVRIEKVDGEPEELKVFFLKIGRTNVLIRDSERKIRKRISYCVVNEVVDE